MTDEDLVTTEDNNEHNKKQIKMLINNNESTSENSNPISNDIRYQPLSYDTYKFFVKFSPYVEKIILNNINKYILQSPQDLQELKAFSKLDKEYTLCNNLIEYLNLYNQTNHEVTFNSKIF